MTVADTLFRAVYRGDPVIVTHATDAEIELFAGEVGPPRDMLELWSQHRDSLWIRNRHPCARVASTACEHLDYVPPAGYRLDSGGDTDPVWARLFAWPP